jgi:hypothetical protein
LVTENPGRLRKLLIDVHAHELRVLAQGMLRCEVCGRRFVAWVWLDTPTLPFAQVLALRALPSPIGGTGDISLDTCEWYEEPEDRN